MLTDETSTTACVDAPATVTAPASKRSRALVKKAEKASTESVASTTAEVGTTAKAKKSVAVVAGESGVLEATRAAKQSKTKLVRDSFTMPDEEYQAIAAIKKRCLGAGVAAKKSEVLRAAVMTLAGRSDEEIVAAITGLNVIKTGRPARNTK